MAGRAAVGVDDDLATGETGVADRAADHEATGRVDQHLVVVVGELLGNHGSDHVLDQVGPDHRVAVDAVVVLGRDQHRAELGRLAVDVVEGHLGLAVGPQVGHGARPTDLAQPLGEAVGGVDRQRHEDVGLAAGVAEHHALVARALIVDGVAGGAGTHLFALVDALGDVDRLLVDRDHDAAGAAVEAVGLLVVADPGDRVAYDAGDVDIRGGRDLTGDDGEAGGDEGLASHPAGGVLLQQGVEDRVRDLVGHLVGMTFGDRLGRERVVVAHSGSFWFGGSPTRSLGKAPSFR